ncbi:glycosyltransferase family 4 protein [Thermotoga neapolitana]|uniref:Glycosyl transferase, group 1 n=1 Tax=Thermotoga neapolitana (strain ATCC 49049 / DSM 4359 / NBRC 107923 / NS-E) TaxID=309803 RepID=B9KB08_THENN|nr:glycosyltransferase family 4 protein [Thermotoga neapolitana]ACM22204.1 Glycosyl transferase, group 1 [Thermotoga neapolitana DSM 4359]HBF10787.1 hypothetical protein [Thermotoga neapolitana]
MEYALRDKNIPILRRILYKKVKERILKEEIEVIRNADTIFITTEKEKQFFKEKIEESDYNKIQVAYNGVDEKILEVGKKRVQMIRDKAFVFNNRLLFLGTLNYYPNEIAAIRLVEKIFPQILKHKKDLELYIVGSNPSNKLKRLCGNNAKIKLLGYVEDLHELLVKTDIIILPMTVVSGIQNKLLTGLSSAIPVVITSQAIFDDKLQHLKNVMVAETDDDYVNAVVKLYESPSLYFEIAENAFKFADENLRWSKVIEKYMNAILS